MRPLATFLLVWMTALSAWADGQHSHSIEASSETGATVVHVEDREQIAVFELAGDYDRIGPGGGVNVGPRWGVSQEYYQGHPDDVDFLIIFTLFDYDLDGLAGFHVGAQNQVQGIGLPIYDNTASFGSAGRLQGYVDLGPLDSWTSDPLDPQFERVLEAAMHELFHQWGVFVDYRRDDGSISDRLRTSTFHWSFLLDSDASVLYGNDWRDEGDSTYTSVAIRRVLSPLDLYLGGFLAPEEVPPFMLLDSPGVDPERLPELGAVVSGSPEWVLIDDIVAAEGPRIPSMEDGPGEFRAAFLLLTRPGEAAGVGHLVALDRIRRALTTRFSVQTGGRGVLSVFPATLPEGDSGSVDTVGAGDLRAEASVLDGLAWLRGRQEVGGYWQDRLETRERDSATVLGLLNQADPLFAGEAGAIAWLVAQGEGSTDFLARRIRVLADLGVSTAALGDDLLDLRNEDGGWGVAAGHASDPVDTAIALGALAETVGLPGSALAEAVAWLEAAQAAEGGWGETRGGESRMGSTSVVAQTIHEAEPESPALGPAATWIASQQNPDGGFGDSPSTSHDTADALQSLIVLSAIEDVDASAARSYLETHQTLEGSWEGSVETTACVIAALQRFSFPNWQFATATTFEPAEPRDGERVGLSVVIRNDGNASAPLGKLRLFEGDPAAGGAPAEEVVIPELAPGTSIPMMIFWDTFDREGVRNLYLQLDPDSEVEEGSELDNITSVEITVLPAPPGVELEVSEGDFLVTPASPDSLPVDLAVSVIVRNLGDTDATEVRVALFAAPDLLLEDRHVDIPQRSSVPLSFLHPLSQGGPLTLLISADPDDEIEEDDETNNSASFVVAPTPTVDLAVSASDLSVDPDPTLVHSDATFTLGIWNHGTVDSPSFEATFEVSDGVEVFEIGRRTLAIPAGNRIEESLSWRVDREGSLALLVQLDPTDDVAESDETNNVVGLVFDALPVSGPNVAISYEDFEILPTPGLEGRAVELSILIRNTGASDLTDVEVAFFDGDPGIGTPIVASTTVASLPAGSQALAVATWPAIPDAAARLVFAFVDPLDQITEFSEDDNQAFLDLEVLSLPDLAVSAGTALLDPPFPRLADPVTLRAELTNFGEQVAESVAYRVLEEPSGAVVASGTLASLAGSSAVLVESTWTLGSQVEAVVLEVDPGNSIGEGEESNNRVELPVATQDGPVFVTRRYISPNGDGIQDETTLYFELPAVLHVAIDILDDEGELLRRVERAEWSSVREGSWLWDGKDLAGRLVDDGEYRLRVFEVDTLVDQGEATVIVDTDRSPLLDALGSEFESVVNLTCNDGGSDPFLLNEAIERATFYRWGSSQLPEGVFQMSAWRGSEREILDWADEIVLAPGGEAMAIYRSEWLGPGNVADRIWLADGDGSNLREVFGLAEMIGFRDHGRYLIVVADDDSIVEVAFDDLSTRVVYASSQPIYTERDFLSPDGGVLLIAEGGSTDQFLQLDLLSGATQFVRSLGGDLRRFAYRTFWAPTSERFVLLASGSDELWVYLRSGPFEHRVILPRDSITTIPEYIPYGPFPVGSVAPYISDRSLDSSWLTWSGDGDQLAVKVQYREAGNSFGGLFRYDLATSSIQVLAWLEPVVSNPASFDVSVLVKGAWQPRGQLHYATTFRVQGLKLEVDPDEELRIRVRQQGLDEAELEATWIEIGSRKSPLKSASLVASGVDVGSPLGRPDRRSIDLHEKEVELVFSAPGRKHVRLAMVAREAWEENLSTSVATPEGLAGSDLLTLWGETLHWAPGDDRLLYAYPFAYEAEQAWVLDAFSGELERTAFPGWFGWYQPFFTPSGRTLLFRDGREAWDLLPPPCPESWLDVFAVRSLHNLTAVLRARPVEGDAWLLEGTAMDMHFRSFRLDYADTAEPDVWYPLAPPSAETVLDDVLLTWIPPGPGIWEVRLTVEDLAGNRRQASSRVTTAAEPSLTDVWVDPRTISASGNPATIHYRVLSPVNVEIVVENELGHRVRSFSRPHGPADIGSEQNVVWNARDEGGIVVPDGDYRIVLQSWQHFVTVDSTPPGVSLNLASAYQRDASSGAVAVAPRLGWSIVENRLETAILETGLGADPLSWWTLDGSAGPPGPKGLGLSLERFTDHSFRLDVADLAGNRRLVEVGLGAEELIIVKAGNHDLQTGGGFAGLSGLAYLPMGVEGAPSVLDLQAREIRLAIAETLREPIVGLFLQVRPFSASSWSEELLSLFFEHGSMLPEIELPAHGGQAIWDAASLVGDEVFLFRLRAVDMGGRSHLSNVFGARFGGGLEVNVMPEDLLPSEIADLLESAGESPFERLVAWVKDTIPTPLAQVNLTLQSNQDSRFDVPVSLEPIAEGENVVVFAAEDWQGCIRYDAQATAVTEPYIDPRTGELLVQTFGPELVGYTTPCVSVKLRAGVVTGGCGEAPPGELAFELRPRAQPGVALQHITLARVDADGAEQVFWNVIAPNEPEYEVRWPTAGWPEGEIDFVARVRDVEGRESVDSETSYVDRTPALIEITAPPEGANLCGVPRNGKNVVDIEGALSDDYGFSFVLEVDDPERPGRWMRIGGEGRVPEQADGVAEALDADSVLGVLGSVSNRVGEIQSRLQVVDWSGQRYCAARSFHFDGVMEEPEIDSGEIFSPNGDGTLEELPISFASAESGFVEVEIYPGRRLGADLVEISGPMIRDLVAERVPTGPAGGSTSWDGLDDLGLPAPDGVYVVVGRFEDGCGNRAAVQSKTEIDRIAPVVELDQPLAGAVLEIVHDVWGSVADPNLEVYSVELGLGADPATWTQLATGNRLRDHEFLAQVSVVGLSGDAVVRLWAKDSAFNLGETRIPVLLAPGELLLGLDALPRLFSPNGDGRREAAALRIQVSADSMASLVITDEAGVPVRTLLAGDPLAAGATSLPWDGRDSLGGLLPDGLYFATLQVTSGLLQQDAIVSLEIDRTPPLIETRSPEPEGFAASSSVVDGRVLDAHLLAWTLEIGAGTTPTSFSLLADGQAEIDGAMAPLAGLSEGEWTLRLRASDEAESSSEILASFAIDETAPEVELRVPIDGLFLGDPIAAEGRVVEDHLGDWVLEFGAGESPGAWTVIASGTEPVDGILGPWDPSALPDGPYTLRLRATDRASWQAGDLSLVTVDRNPPIAVIDSPASGSFVTAPRAILGTADDAHLLDYRLEVAARASTAFSTIASGAAPVISDHLGSWSILPADGSYDLRLVVRDRAGQETTSLVQVEVDQTPPDPPTGLAGVVSASDAITLSWMPSPSSDVVGYELFRDGVALPGAPSASTSYVDAGLAEGRYRYRARALDEAGWLSESTPEIEVSLDHTPPVALLHLPLEGDRLGGLVDIRGTAFSSDDFREYRLALVTQAGSRQELVASPLPVQADLLVQWSTLGHSEGAILELELEAEDLSGNVASDSITVIVDNEPPATPTGLAASVSGDDVHLLWNANTESDLVGYLLYRDGQLANADGPVVTDLEAFAISGLSYDDLDRPDGDWTYTLVALDEAGNLSLPSSPATASLDRHAPHADWVLPDNGDRFDLSLYLLAETLDSDVAEVRFEVRAVGDPTWVEIATDPLAPWESELDPAAMSLPRGDLDLRAVATDEAGAIDPAPATVRVEYADLTPPRPVEGLTSLVDGGEVSLAWDASSEGDLAGYHVERLDELGGVTRITSTPETSTAFLDAARPDGPWRYRMIAVDDLDNESLPSEEVSALVWTISLEIPWTPTDGSVIDLYGSGRPSLTIAGRVVNASGTQALPAASAGSGGDFHLADLGLELGGNDFSVFQEDGDGNRSREASLKVVAGEPPSAPTGLAASVLGFDVELTWNANPEPNIVGYRVFRDGMPLNADSTLSGIAATSVSSADPAHPGADAHDADPATAWRALGLSDEWISLAWSQARWIVGVDLGWQVQGETLLAPVAYRVALWDGRVWVPVATVVGDVSALRSITFERPYWSDRLRVEILGAEAAWGLAEISVRLRPVASSPVLDTGLGDGTPSYSVTAVDNLGLESLPSIPLDVAVGDVTPPEPPIGLAAQVSGFDVLLTWAASPSADVVAYSISRDGMEIARHVNLGDLSYLDAARPNGTYVYTLQAQDSAGNLSADSNPATALIEVVLPEPPLSLQVTASAAGSALDLAWLPAAGGPTAGAYRVHRATQAGGSFVAVATVPGLLFRDMGLVDGVELFYVVRALDPAGNASLDSNEASGIPMDSLAPPAPTLTFPGTSTTEHRTTSIAGRAEPGSEVHLLRNGSFVALLQASPALLVDELGLMATGAARLAGDGRSVWLEELGADRWVDLASLAERSIAGIDGPVRWHQDGRGVLFVEGGQVRDYDLESEMVTTLATLDSLELALSLPDRRSLALVGSRGGQSGLWHFDRSLAAWRLLAAADPGSIDLESVSVSRDGSYLVFARTAPAPSTEVVGLASGMVSIIETQPGISAPHFLADGLALVSTFIDSGFERVFHYELATGIKTTWSPAGSSYLHPRSSPDGSAYVALHEGLIQLMEAGGTVGETLFDASGLTVRDLRWSPGGSLLVVADELVRLLMPGHFQADSVDLEIQANAFEAWAEDEAGNRGPASAEMIVTYQPDDLPDLEVTLAAAPSVPIVGASVQIFVSVRNAGSAPSSPVTLDLTIFGPQGSTQILLSGAEIAALSPGETTNLGAQVSPDLIGTWTALATLDPLDQLVESDEGNNQAQLPIEVLEEPAVLLSLTTDAEAYGSDQDVGLELELVNGLGLLDATLVISIFDEQGFEVVQLHEESLLDWPFGRRLERSLAWNTGSTFAGPYRAEARLFDESEGLLVAAISPFAITDHAELTAAVETDRGVYGFGETVLITMTAHYLAGNELAADLAASIRLFDAFGVEVAYWANELADLLPGQSASFAAEHLEPALAAGTYRVTALLERSGDEVAEAETFFAVGAAPASLAGQLVLSPERVGSGDVLEAFWQVDYSGEVDLNGAVIHVLLIDPATGIELDARSENVDLPPGASVSGSEIFATSGLDLSMHLVVLEVDGDLLDLASFLPEDRMPPELDYVAPRVGGYVGVSKTVTVLAYDALTAVSTVELSLDGGPFREAVSSVPSEDLYTVVLADLEEGSHRIEIGAEDIEGNRAQREPIDFVADFTPPTIVVTGVVGGGVYPGPVVPEIVIADETWLAESSLTLDQAIFSSGTTVDDLGEHTLQAWGRDGAGNETLVDLIFSLEETGEAILDANQTAVLVGDVDGDSMPSPGDRILYSIEILNFGPSSARMVELTEPLPAYTQLVAGSLDPGPGTVVSLDPIVVMLDELGSEAAWNLHFEVDVATPLPAGVDRLSAQASIASEGLAVVLSDDPGTPQIDDATVTELQVTTELVAEKRDELAQDGDQNGQPSPGDELLYTISWQNFGNVGASGLVFEDHLPPELDLVSGSVEAPAGAVVVSLEPSLRVELPILEVGGPIELTFRARIDPFLGNGRHEIVNQGWLAHAEGTTILTDDPDHPGFEDPTVTVVEGTPIVEIPALGPLGLALLALFLSLFGIRRIRSRWEA